MILFYISFVLSSNRALHKLINSGICGFMAYFKYKDFFAGKEMILLLCIAYVFCNYYDLRYYFLVCIDYLYSDLVIKNSFIIGSLPDVTIF